MMRAVRKRINGHLLAADGRHYLRLAADGPELILRFALVRRGSEEHIFPAFVLDDWGTEIRKLKLYEWVRENGDLFPRAEIFGFDVDGSEAQLFLREMELYAKLPCYAYPDAETPLAEGSRLAAIIWSDPTLESPAPDQRPSDLPFVLRRAALSWWAVPIGTAPGWTPPRR